MDDKPLAQPVRREVDVYIAVSRGRELAKQIGFDEIDRTRPLFGGADGHENAAAVARRRAHVPPADGFVHGDVLPF